VYITDILTVFQRIICCELIN